jgi:predicted Rossmann-fold nucleotide-binding protein
VNVCVYCASSKTIDGAHHLVRKLGYHSNPIAIVNANGFFDPLHALLDHIDQTNFSPKITDGSLYHVADTPLAALTHLSEFKSA